MAVVIAAGAATGVVFGSDGLLVFLAAAQVATLGLVALLARRLWQDRRLHRERRQREEQDRRRSIERLKRLDARLSRIDSMLEPQADGQDGPNLWSGVHDLSDRVRALHRQTEVTRGDLAAVAARVETSFDALAEKLDTVAELAAQSDAKADERFRDAGPRIRDDTWRVQEQTEALIGLYYDIRPVRALPPVGPSTGGWSASFDLLRFLYNTTRQEGRSRLLECGSGVSTLVMAYALRDLGHGRVVALEHHEDYAERTRLMLAEHQLTDWAEVRPAPLMDVDIDGEKWSWYDTSAIPDGPFDLILVDGPPGNTGPAARFPAVPVLYDKFAADTMIILDDYHRPEEQLIGRRWKQMHPEFELQRIKHFKGSLILRRHSSEPAAAADSK